METIKLVLICPECGNSTWRRTETGDFECLACGDVYGEEDMCATAEPVNRKTE